jgi:mannose-6-phosphate isomerase
VIAPYPLIFEPVLLEKVWGGRRLERLGKVLPEGRNIGESWELADLAATSASGAGGGAARSVIANGPLAGKTLAEALALWKRSLLGSAAATREGGFPLLVKFLDARENLSLQVHPSRAYAAAHPAAFVKNECWYVLAAEPVNGRAPMIYKGIKAGVSRGAFAKAVGEGSVVDEVVAVPAVVGECHTFPSGTCHALGAGVLIAEVQTPSDTTFRVYDWGRTGRELHVAQALECMEMGPAPAAARLAEGRQTARLARTESFDVHEVALPRGGAVQLSAGDAGPQVLIVLDGGVTLRTPGADPVSGALGATILVPAAAAVNTVAVARPGTRLLRVVVR